MWKGVAYMHAITYNLDRQTDRQTDRQVKSAYFWYDLIDV